MERVDKMLRGENSVTQLSLCDTSTQSEREMVQQQVERSIQRLITVWNIDMSPFAGAESHPLGVEDIED